MTEQYGWGHDLSTAGDIGLESFGQDLDTALSQGPSDVASNGFFKPVNIHIEKGIYYVTIYTCYINTNPHLLESFSIFLASLKPTDKIKLSVNSTLSGIPFIAILDILAALANTPAKIEILLEQIVIDALAYFYLIADSVTPKLGGALYVPSYIDQRSEDTSRPWRAAHDFYEWIIDDAVIRNRLTAEEAEALRAGRHVVILDNRFAK